MIFLPPNPKPAFRVTTTRWLDSHQNPSVSHQQIKPEQPREYINPHCFYIPVNKRICDTSNDIEYETYTGDFLLTFPSWKTD